MNNEPTQKELESEITELKKTTRVQERKVKNIEIY